MKKLLLIFTLSFSAAMYSSPVRAEWTRVIENMSGDTFYVDFERIRKHDGYVYYWTLANYLKPTETGMLSAKAYIQADCKLFRHKHLSFSFHKEPMGEGTGNTFNPDQDWQYPPPNSSRETILKLVCSQ